MKPRILLVDDEEKLLLALKRNLRKNYHIETAESGKIALEKIANLPKFEVVVSDMNMPEMDGIQFLCLAKKVSPSTTRIMLTGNKDQNLAQKALNQGDIFRFLNKPCSKENYIVALNDAIKQHRLVIAEKVILEKTLQGCVEVLIDILSFSNPDAFGRTKRIRKLVMLLAEAMNITDPWQYKTAAMLSQIGTVIMPPGEIKKHCNSSGQSDEEKALYQHHALITADLIDKIPRLEKIAEIIRYQNKGYDGSGVPVDDVKEDKIPLGSRMLKLVADFDSLRTSDLSFELIFVELSKAENIYDPELFQLLKIIAESLIVTKVIIMKVSQLTQDLTLAKDIRTHQDALVLSEGDETSDTVIAKLKNYVASDLIDDEISILITVID